MGDHIKISDLVKFNSVSKPSEARKNGVGIALDVSRKYETIFVYWLSRSAPDGWYLPQHLQILSEEENDDMVQLLRWRLG